MADTEAAQPYLVPLLQDTNNRVLANAVIALKDYQAVDVTPTLSKMVEDQAPLMRRSAFYAITDLATQEANALIARLVEDPDETLRSKVQSYVEMCADDGDTWAIELRDRREAAGEAPLAPDDFAEFAGGPESLPSSGASRDESATEARQMLKNFRAQDRDGKLAMIARARDDVCLESYFFLREVLEEEDFEIKVQAKMALRSFDEETFRGVKQATELWKELNQRSQAADSRGYWEGPFPDRLVMLNALREDTLEMLVETLHGEEVQEAFLCYNSDRLEPFRTGRKPLDSNRYSNLVTLVPQVNRTTSDTFHGSLLHSVKRPAYLLALMLESRLLLFLRGSLQSTVCSSVSVPWIVIDRAEANRVGSGTTVAIEAMGVLVEVPELHGEDARRIYDRAHAREQSKMNHALENLSTTKEFRRIDLLLQGGVITQEEYEKRKALLEKQRKD
jgi:hypothetical protein